MNYLKLFLLLIMLFVGANASAQSTLVVELRNGSKAVFLLAEKPCVTFAGEQLDIVSSSASMEFNRSDVKNWHFADTASSVENIMAEAKATLDGNSLVVIGVTDDTAITIYTVNGVAAKRSVAINGTCTIPLDDLSAGVYILKYNNTTFKFLKK